MVEEVDMVYPKPKDLGLSEEFVEKLTAAANLVKTTSSPIRVISHYDADGLSAGVVLSAILLRLNAKFHLSLFHGLEPDSKVFTELKNSKSDLTIFSDMGSGQLDTIENFSGWVIILDHHAPRRDTEAKNIIHINTHNFGLDGTYEICASTLAFLFAIHLDTLNWDQIPVALAGAIGDKQNKNGFKGLNQKLVDEAVRLGIIDAKKRFKPHGRTILEAIANCTDPYFVGLSNNETATKDLLTSLDIIPDTNLDEIDRSSIRRLASYLVLKLLEQDIPPDDAEELIVTKYSNKNHADLEEFSHQINACGRMDMMGIGVAAGLGDEWALKTAEKIRREYKQKVLEGLNRLETDPPKKLKNIQYFFEETATLAGTFAGIGMMFFFNQHKPVLGLTRTEDKIKISGRGTNRMVRSGLDLANAFGVIAPEFNGTGGGHKIAAGATIPLESEQEFLDKVDEMVGEQLDGFNKE